MSLLIFQHFTREKRDAYTQRMASELAKHTVAASVLSLVTANVLFLLACQEKREGQVRSAVRNLTARWRNQFWLQEVLHNKALELNAG